MTVSSRSPSVACSDSGDETPKSIASLRSKFENLATGIDAVQSNGHQKPGPVASTGSAKGGFLGAPGEEGNETEKAKPVVPPKPASRPVTPVPTSLVISQSVTFQPSTTTRIPPSRPVTPKPLYQPSRASDPSIVSQGENLNDTYLKPPEAYAATASATSSIPNPSSAVESTSSSPINRRLAPPPPSKSPSIISGTTSATPSAVVTPACSGSERGSSPEAEQTISVRVLRERFAAQVNKSTTVVPTKLADIPNSTRIPSTTKSAPFIKYTANDRNTGDAPHSPYSTQIHSSRPDHSFHTSALASSSSASYPPSPISQNTSPIPPPINRAHKPQPRQTMANSAITHPEEKILETPFLSSPHHILPNRPSLSSRSSSVAHGISPPQLPVRRPTILSTDSLESVINLSRNAPILTREESLNAIHGVASLPSLSGRLGTGVVGRTELETNTGSSAGPPPPRLPARHATLSEPITIAPPNIPPPLPHFAYPGRVGINAGILPPPPLRSAIINPSSPPRRSNTISRRISSSDPTPHETTYLSGRRDRERDEKEVYSEDEDDEPADPSMAGLSAQAKRMLEDFPDTTQANRKAPVFIPDVKLKDCHHVSAFATFGRYICTGAHHVRVYDTLLGDHAISIIDLKETDLENKSKDPRITAMCFRPGATKQEEGQYLWCGTKDGHLWELDIATGHVSNTKAFAHMSSICNIWRHKQNILSLDDLGKLLVFEVGTGEGERPRLIRTLRIGEKFAFAKMVCGKLWISSGPTVRSTTSAATSRGPIIRVYDPCSEGTMPPVKSLFTTEWTGAVTSATYMPLSHQTIYLGHEGGFISLWNGSSLTCEGVMKISNTDVLALEGVGEYLWMGNRKGQIWVFDVEEKPWKATNIWVGHYDSPVQALVVDPYSIEYAGRYTCWSFARDSLQAWDGLLSVDWIDKQLTVRQPEYCTFRPINILVCTWNIDSARPGDLTGSEVNRTFLNEVLLSVDSPDIIVFGFQEVIPLTDKKYTAKTLLFGGKSKDGGSAGDKISHAYRHWIEKLQSSVKSSYPTDCPYVKIHSEYLVGLLTCIFAKSSERSVLRDLDMATVKRGIGGIYGNKGAIIARLVMDDTSLCFINVHLAAGQSQKSARNADLAGIMEDKAIFPPAEELPFVNGGCGTAIMDHEVVFLNGDLNYRIDQRRENVISSIANNEISYLLEHDQLRKEMRTNHAFRLRSFEEAPITFCPTYKYNPGTQDYDTSEKRRIPAWCDRILYSKSQRIKPLNYQRYEPTVSDHRPVSASFAVTLKAVDPLKMMETRRIVEAEWETREKQLLEQMSKLFDSIE
ncbi:hypothetical protein L204_105460 [Cryptococcus depauperatus]|nr:hypothetical protein L204_02773 [Cryptococcus depauperatus CBS 7855]